MAGDFAGERRAAAADALLPLAFVAVFALDFAFTLALAGVVGLAFVLAGALALALAGLADARGARRFGEAGAELSATGAAVDARVSGGATGATEASAVATDDGAGAATGAAGAFTTPSG